jgi:transcriptional regulator with XRE-family HTH domain
LSPEFGTLADRVQGEIWSEETAVASLAERVRELRRARGWTQKELEAHAGVSYVTISHIETGITTEISTATLGRLATTFDVTTDYLMGRSDSPTCQGSG